MIQKKTYTLQASASHNTSTWGPRCLETRTAQPFITGLTFWTQICLQDM